MFTCSIFSIGRHKADESSHITGVVYSNISLQPSTGYPLLSSAMNRFLESLAPSPYDTPKILWSLNYSRGIASSTPTISASSSESAGIITLPASSSLDIAWDDSILEAVRQAWMKITGLREGFMTFEDRAGEADDDGDEG